MSKENLDKVVHWANIASIFIVSISVIAIIFSAIFFFYPKNETEISVKVNYTLSIDTTKIKTVNKEFKENLVKIKELDRNNKLVYKNINKLIEDFEKKQKNNIETSKNQSDFTSYASAIFALIVSITGFFGFKSINDMKKAAIDAATEESKRVSKEISEASFNNFIENEVTEVARRIANDTTILNLTNFQSDLEELRNKIDECCNNNIDVIPDNEENNEDVNDAPLFNDDLV